MLWSKQGPTNLQRVDAQLLRDPQKDCLDRYQQSPARKKSLKVDGAILLAWADAGSTNLACCGWRVWLWSSVSSVLWSLADGIVDLELSSLQQRLALAIACLKLCFLT